MAPPPIPPGSLDTLKPGETRVRTRSQGTPSAMLRSQQINLESLLTQSGRGRMFLTRIADRKPSDIQIQRKIDHLEKLWSEFESTHHELAAITDDPDVTQYMEDDSFRPARKSYYELIEELEGMFDFPSQPPVGGTIQAPIVTTRSTIATLERVPIPEFDGTSKAWPSYRDQFEVMVKNDNTIGDVFKLAYLKKSLKGNALALISNVDVSENGFEVAWKIITDHYQNLNSLVFSNIVRLLNLEPADSRKTGQLERLYIETREVVTSLKSLKEPVEQWSSLLVVLTLLRLDTEIRKDWEHSLGRRETFPTFVELDKFLQTRIHVNTPYSFKADMSRQSTSAFSSKQNDKETKAKFSAHVSTNAASKCSLCTSTSHKTYQCPELLKLDAKARFNRVKAAKLCINCLKSDHSMVACKSPSKCKTCQQTHNTVLHDESKLSKRDALKNQVQPTNQVNSHAATQVPGASKTDITASGKVLLATAIVKISSVEGGELTVRALIDQGSERSFMSENAARRLRLKRLHANATISGIGNSTPGHVKHTGQICVKALNNQQSIKVTCLILAKLTSYTPNHRISQGRWYHVNHLPLADNELNSNRPIEVILGADVYGSIILDGIHRFPREPIAQSTIFGWILTGPVVETHETNEQSREIVNSLHVNSNDALAKSLTRFWELESTPAEIILTEDEQKCETLFANTTTRDSSGQYTVHLPFASDLPVDIGDSYEIASKQYARLERRLTRDSELNSQYHAFLKEYRDLGHMSPYMPRSEGEQGYYLPHHPVVRETSATTRVRVVFNASCPTSNGKSLNDNLLTGPKLQEDLSSIIMRWRLHRYVMIADAEKMFRQIRVTPEHTPYQLILWRPTPTEPIKTYKLDTVTYGTACAPYLSLRVLYQLANDEAESYPLASQALLENTYVDDLVFGSHSIDHTRNIRDEILNATPRGHFSFRKWIANDPTLINDLSRDIRDKATNKEFTSDETKRVLGISWRTNSDNFEYSVIPENSSLITKRAILSHTAKLYDPLGWISPVVINAKIFMQQLWTDKVGWDDIISPALQTVWSTFSKDLINLTRISIPRWIEAQVESNIQLHVFCDASQHAYAASIYSRVETRGKIVTKLLVSKTKVAPLKSVTIPRLELCAAELGSRLLVWTKSSLNRGDIESFAWSDSSVTLAWIAASPARWKVFVANRVARIQTRCPNVPWRYVPTDTNPADIASRGCSASDLIENDLWWHGPIWLNKCSDEWPSTTPEANQFIDLESRPINAHLASTSNYDYSARCSDWGRLIKVTAIFMRYLAILSKKIKHENIDALVTPSAKTLIEFATKARKHWLREAQKTSFADEISIIQKNDNLPRRNRLIALNAYLDDQGLLRVGGRLEHADALEAVKHPVLLGKCHITTLIIRQAHLRTLHGGSALTSRLLAESYWIFRVKSAVRSEIRKCVQCVRYRAETLSQQMAPIPALRVQRRRAFAHVGIDYAGPIMVKFGTGRGHQAHKAYIAVFVCMITRAIHLELVNAYSTPAFLAAFKRFTSRRGLPSLVISDNGTNFNGASRELARDFKQAMRHPSIASSLALEGIEWKFIPPGSPHFGGMWESGVKSVKHHLRRVSGDRKLSVEEFTTLLCQIEACLNSRPIAGFSNDPDDLSYLTPGHFLIGTALIAPPEPSLIEINEARLSRWQVVQVMAERFWQIWSSDYLRSLQTRAKWRDAKPNIRVGAIVLIKDENLPPSKWALGRVLHCHEGSDGNIRVCNIRTAVTILTRPIHKLCLLPVEDRPDHDDEQPNASIGN